MKDGERLLPEVASPAPLVLVVDDEPEVRHFMESLLTEHGYQVVLASHGQDALQRLRERCPDLILLDLKMPVMDGWAFRTYQRYFTEKKQAAVPVLLMTGVDIPAMHVETLRADGFIKKPFDPGDVLQTVSAAIASQRSASGSIPPPSH